MSNSPTPIFGGRYHTDADGKVVPMAEQETDEHCALHDAKSAPADSAAVAETKPAAPRGKSSSHKHA